MRRGSRAALALALMLAVAQAASEERRVERPLWRDILAAPRFLFEALNWPAKRLLFWAEDIRLDRRIHDAIIWKDDDDRPIDEPVEDEDSAHVWWQCYEATVVEPIGRMLDPSESLPAALRAARLLAPDEAANRNAVDEVPDSTWFTNRHAREPLGLRELERGPNREPPPQAPFEILSGKPLGMESGFWIRDATDRRFLLRLDPRGFPDLTTGAELVSSKIVHALGWNVPEYHLIALDPAGLSIAANAWIRDRYNRKRRFTRAALDRLFRSTERRPDGSVRALASLALPGIPKGGFHMTGVRPDDANDTIPHEDRRDLRGLVVAAAWLDHVDFRSGNTLDVFVPHAGEPRGRGHLVHYLVDWNATLGAWATGWKPRWMGHEYVLRPVGFALDGLGLRQPPWADIPLTHPALGYFASKAFDPERWKPIYPAAPFDRATLLDRFWGARLVASLGEAELRAIAATAAWSDRHAAEILVRILRERQRTIAKTYFDVARLAPLDRFEVAGDELRFRDLAVEVGIAEAADARYRARVGEREIVAAHPPLPAEGPRVTIEASHDGGKSWSPPVVIALENGRILGLERSAR